MPIATLSSEGDNNESKHSTSSLGAYTLEERQTLFKCIKQYEVFQAVLVLQRKIWREMGAGMELQALQRLATFSEMAGASRRRKRQRPWQVMGSALVEAVVGSAQAQEHHGTGTSPIHCPFPLRRGTEPRSC